MVSNTAFIKFNDCHNSSIAYVANESQKEKVEKSLSETGIIASIYSYYEELLEIDLPLSLNSVCYIIVVPYLNFMNNLSCLDLELKKEFYFSIIKFPNLYIIPDKLIINEKVPEILNYQLRSLSKIFISNFIGGIVHEEDYSDFWLICGIENWLAYNFMKKCYGNTYSKGAFLESMAEYKKIVKNGKEVRPLYPNNYTHPVELQTDSNLYLKSFLVMLLLESLIEKVFVQKAIKNIINERSKVNYTISTESFIKILKKNCGIPLKKFTNLWIFKTGMLNLKMFYSYKEDTNSIDVELLQTPENYDYAVSYPHFNIDGLDIDNLAKINKLPPVLNFTSKANRFYDVNLNVTIYQTNGFEVLKENQVIILDNDKDNVIRNIPLITKLRKCPIKKREQEFIQELISNTNVTKIYSNEEIEKILTRHSVLWIRIDSEITSLRKIQDISKEDILLEYIKLFKDPDIGGQFESLKNIYYRSESHSNSLIILETFIKTNQHVFYKLRIYALKIYVKIINELQQEKGYLFLLELLEELNTELIKSKTNLNREVYLLLKYVIRYLGDYKEDSVNEFNVIGKVKISTIQSKIIEKFMIILLSNEFNTINGLNDSYINREILVGCSKLQLQEKTIYILRKILQMLRIEKLKRSVNDIIVIACIQSYINVLIKNNFFHSSFQEDTYLQNLINGINEEIDYFINCDYETQELGVYCAYFILFMILSKSTSSASFTAMVMNLLKPIFKAEHVAIGESEDLAEFVLGVDDLRNKVAALALLLNNYVDIFIAANDTSALFNMIKQILKSEFLFHRIELRQSYIQLLSQLSKLELKEELRQFKPNKPHLSDETASRLFKFASIQYADEVWLAEYINSEKDNKNDNKSENSSNNAAGQEQKGESLNRLIQKYQTKYNDPFLLNNFNLGLEKYSMRDCILLITNKMLEHPQAENFNYPLNEETLCELYEGYFKIIKTPMDLDTISKKIEAKSYNNFKSYLADIRLVFTNCREYNERKSYLHQAANQMEDFFNILIYPIRNKDFSVELQSELKFSLKDAHSMDDGEIEQVAITQQAQTDMMDVDDLYSENY